MISKGYEEELIEALERKPEMVNYQPQGRRGTLLFTAAALGRLRVAQYLLQHGANPNHCGEYLDVPLLICLQNVGVIKTELSESQGMIAVFDLLLNHGASPKLMGYQFSSIANPDGTFKTERTLILSADTLIKLGIKYQRSPNDHSIARSWLIAHLRDHMDLPVDAMLPLNANSLYLRPEPTAPK